MFRWTDLGKIQIRFEWEMGVAIGNATRMFAIGIGLSAFVYAVFL